jgi:hypothetical protein
MYVEAIHCADTIHRSLSAAPRPHALDQIRTLATICLHVFFTSSARTLIRSSSMPPAVVHTTSTIRFCKLNSRGPHARRLTKRANRALVLKPNGPPKVTRCG